MSEGSSDEDHQDDDKRRRPSEPEPVAEAPSLPGLVPRVNAQEEDAAPGPAEGAGEETGQIWPPAMGVI